LIDKKILIEDLIDQYPQSIQFLMEKGIKCIACGEPIWGTLEDAIREKGFTEEQLKELIEELNIVIS
jgi:methionine synthase II (cobalamin-independent)